MVPFTQLLLPIGVSALLVFAASTILHMLLKFWHASDYGGFSNESEVGAAIRNGNAGPGMYMIPLCTADSMRHPDVVEKFETGPVGIVVLRRNGAMNMGPLLALWFGFCVLVGLFCALIAGVVLAEDAAFAYVFHVTALAAFMGYGVGPIPNAIWRGHPWGCVGREIVDGLIYALITGGVFAWMWPH